LSKTVTVNGNSYTLAQQGDEPPYGEDQADLIEALVDVAATVVATGDITSTTFTLGNNTSSTVTGLVFDPAVVRAATITYTISRTTATQEVTEHGVMLLTCVNTGTTFAFSQYSTGDAGVTFTVASTGQFSFTSSNLTGGSYVGKLTFSAKSITQ